jgi:hypothetical protein
MDKMCKKSSSFRREIACRSHLLRLTATLKPDCRFAEQRKRSGSLEEKVGSAFSPVRFNAGKS